MWHIVYSVFMRLPGGIAHLCLISDAMIARMCCKTCTCMDGHDEIPLHAADVFRWRGFYVMCGLRILCSLVKLYENSVEL